MSCEFYIGGFSCELYRGSRNRFLIIIFQFKSNAGIIQVQIAGMVNKEGDRCPDKEINKEFNKDFGKGGKGNPDKNPEERKVRFI